LKIGFYRRVQFAEWFKENFKKERLSLTFRAGSGVAILADNPKEIMKKLYVLRKKDDSIDALGLDMNLHIGDNKQIVTQVRINPKPGKIKTYLKVNRRPINMENVRLQFNNDLLMIVSGSPKSPKSIGVLPICGIPNNCFIFNTESKTNRNRVDISTTLDDLTPLDVEAIQSGKVITPFPMPYSSFNVDKLLKKIGFGFCSCQIKSFVLELNSVFNLNILVLI